GSNCTYGGHKITAGLDSNANSVLDSGEVTSTSYTCDGAPGPGVSWVNVTSTTVQAQSSTGYVANNAAQVTITLPTAPSVGDLIEVSGAGAGGWKLAQNASQAIVTKALPATYGNIADTWTPLATDSATWYGMAVSADARVVVASQNPGTLAVSIDSGVTWAPRESSRNWKGVAISADGSKIAAVASGDQIYISSDSGATWTPRGSVFSWQSVSMSADGTKLVAVTDGDQIYTSTDSGLTWTPRDSVRRWYSVASSSDGTKLVAGVLGGQIYTSSDSGVTWTPRDNSRIWVGVASSANGVRLAATVLGGQVYTSGDSGATWTARDQSRAWWSVAMSADGNTLMAAQRSPGRIYLSRDAGVTWAPRANTGDWWGVAMSSDATKLFAAPSGDVLYSGSSANPDRTTPGTAGSLTGGQFDTLRLQYLGSGLFLPLGFESYTGSFTVQ
ncbi:MAG: WD40/YVTN/BNR-like repeat-containing protein, partial [Leptothrix sp. (in: b-proteobacteria)]